MPNNTQLPYSVPTALQGKTREEFQGGKNKVLELLNTLDLVDFLNQFTQQILPLQAAQWFALDCAKLVLYAFEEQYPSDKRVSNCIEVVESYLNGKSTLEELSSAADAACDAAEAADADYFAAYDASAAAYDAIDNPAFDIFTAAYYTVAADFATAAAAAYVAVDAAAAVDAAGVNAAYYASKDDMQGFVKNWIDNYFNI